MSAVLLEIDGPKAVLTLNRPQDGNRMGDDIFHALEAAVHDLTGRSGLRALLLRAEGPNFCVGGAIDEFVRGEEPLDQRLRRELPRVHRVIETLAGLSFPVVSALGGAVSGGGIGFALLADIVLAADDTFFRAGYPGIGLSPDLGGSYQIVRRAGATFASEFLISNRRVEAQEALRAGLVNAVHPAAGLDAAARALLDDLARGPTLSHAAVKRLVAAQAQTPLAAHLDLEMELMVDCAASDDSRRAIEAFLAKRSAVFSGS